jgi:hypothetical protein
MDRSMRRLFGTEGACDGHHVSARPIICAQAPSRPEGRAGAGEAKRSALHGAEHRCSIVVVMADGVGVMANAIPSRRPQLDIECSAHKPPFSRTATGRQARANVTCFAETFSGQTGPDPPEDPRRNRARSVRKTRRAFCCQHAVLDNLKRQ